MSSLYAKATDPRVSAGDHVRSPTPAHMDMRDLAVSFKPERWLGGELDKKATLATFGMGAHFCLGYPLYMQEAVVLLALIARRYDVQAASGHADWGPSAMTAGGSPRAPILHRYRARQYV